MSSNYSRKMYDACYQAELTRTTKGPGNYRVNKEQNPNSPSYPVLDIVSYKDNIYNPVLTNNVTDLINIESHLMRLDDKFSNCSEGRTLDDMNNNAEKLVSKVPSKRENANKKLNSSYSRMERPRQHHMRLYQY